MAKWRKEGLFIKPNFKFKCLGCSDRWASFKEAGYVLSNFPIDDEKPGDYDSYVIDRTFVCILCGFRIVFGIALSKEHFKEIIKYEDEKPPEKVEQVAIRRLPEDY